MDQSPVMRCVVLSNYRVCQLRHSLEGDRWLAACVSVCWSHVRSFNVFDPAKRVASWQSIQPRQGSPALRRHQSSCTLVYHAQSHHPLCVPGCIGRRYTQHGRPDQPACTGSGLDRGDLPTGLHVGRSNRYLGFTASDSDASVSVCIPSKSSLINALTSPADERAGKQRYLC